MTTPPIADPAALAVPGRRPVRTWDLIVSIALMLLCGGLAVILVVLSAFLVMASDPCGGVRCNVDQMGVGFGVALVGPLAVLVLGIVATVIVLVLRRLAFWIPLVAMVLAVGVFVVGSALVIGGVEGATL
jgi:hypothetical protein